MAPVTRIPGGLTRPQRDQLLLLNRLQAESSETAKHIFDEGGRELSSGSIGSLITKGLADKRRFKSAGGGQVTAYWLTEAGWELAPRIAAALSIRGRQGGPGKFSTPEPQAEGRG